MSAMALRVMLALMLMITVACGGSRETGHADEHGHGEEAANAAKGPHGGRMLRDGDLGVEVTIFEQGVPPEFRIYIYDGDKPVAPNEATAQMQLVRLDRTEQITFAPKDDYLLGNAEVVEPHSFTVKLRVTHGGKSHDLGYEQLEGRVHLTEEQKREGGIVVETAGPASIDAAVSLPGEVALNADRTVHIVPRVAGVAARVTKNLGDRVARGDVLAMIESGEIATLRSDYLAAVRRQQLTKATADREEELFRKSISSQEEYLRAKNAYEEASIEVRSAAEKLGAIGIAPASAGRGSLASIALRSPISGTVIRKDLSAGQAVSATDSAFVVADLSSVWIDIAVPANSVGAVRQGQTVTVHAPATNAQTSGTVSYVGSVVAGANRTATARVVIDNARGEWQPGMFVNVLLTTSRQPVPLAVRTEALQTFRDWTVVFIAVGDDYEVRPLELGRKDAQWVEVLGGLKAGQAYVTKNSFLLKADALKAGASHDH
jgi:cobalt-zinc-cadmium efflux system membrane fusion protein